MQLYLVQDDVWDGNADEVQRDLGDESRQAVERMADRLSALRLALGCIEHSDNLRARQIAEILAARLRPQNGTKQVAAMGPHDDVEPMRDRLQAESNNLILVGPFSYLTRLLAMLVGERTHHRLHMRGASRLDRNNKGEWLVRWAISGI